MNNSHQIYPNIDKAVISYRSKKPAIRNNGSSGLKAALIDMDGVLYDSMKYHTLAWVKMVSEQGISCDRNEFYLYEGMTGYETIKLIWERETGSIPTDEKINHLYATKARYFVEMGKKEVMPDADRMLNALIDADVERILVTGSAQSSLLDKLDHDFPGAFNNDKKITAHDVTHGKPDPEPYIRGQILANAHPSEAIVIENAPLGVRAGVASGSFTIAVTTGPIPESIFEKENANLIFPSMAALADAMPDIISALRE